MEKFKRQHREILAKDLVEALNKRNFEAYYAADVEDAKQIAMSMIPVGASVSAGGSVTMAEIGVMDEVKNGKYNFIDRFNPPADKTPDDMLKDSMAADVFLTSSNAVTKDGQLVNIDGYGNRVAAMLYGPKKVIVVVGTNKIADDIDAAVERIKKVAAPINAMRLNRNTPCVKTGRCMDCSSPDRICNMTTIMSYCRDKGRVAVIVVPVELGF